MKLFLNEEGLLSDKCKTSQNIVKIINYSVNASYNESSRITKYQPNPFLYLASGIGLLLLPTFSTGSEGEVIGTSAFSSILDFLSVANISLRITL